MKKNKFILVVFLVLAFGLIIYFGIFNNKKRVETAKKIDTIEKYNYNLYDNSSKKYEKFFEELSHELKKENVDEEKYVELISKLFIIDFYTLDNKLTNLNIGGTEFVHSNMLDNFKEKANATIYKYVESNIYGDRKQKLPIVEDVNVVKIEQKSFEYSETIDKKAFYVNVSWEYEKDLGYENSKTLVFVHEDNKLSLVEMS